MTWDVTDFSSRMIRDMPDAVICSDAQGRIQFWNAGATRIFGFTESEALGQSLDIIIPEPLRQRHWTGFDDTMRSGRTRYGAGDILSVPAVCKDGTRRSIAFTVLPFRDAAGAITGIAAVLRDVTAQFEELKRLRQGLRAQQQGAPGAQGG